MRALLFFVFMCLFLQYWKADREIVVSVQFEHELTGGFVLFNKNFEFASFTM